MIINLSVSANVVLNFDSPPESLKPKKITKKLTMAPRRERLSQLAPENK